MPYAFNEDKSRYDLTSDINAVNAATANIADLTESVESLFKTSEKTTTFTTPSSSQWVYLSFRFTPIEGYIPINAFVSGQSGDGVSIRYESLIMNDFGDDYYKNVYVSGTSNGASDVSASVTVKMIYVKSAAIG